MNKLQANILEGLIIRAVKNNQDVISITLLEALDCSENGLEDSILELLEDGSYIQPSDMTLSIGSIDNILDYTKEKKLGLEFGFSSILESYVISTISEIIEIDLLEWM